LQAPVEIGMGATAGGMIGGDIGAMIGGGIGTVSAALGHPRVAPSIAIGLHGLKSKKAIDLFLKNNPHISAAELSAILAGRATENDLQQAR